MSNEANWLVKMIHAVDRPEFDTFVVKSFYSTKRGLMWFKEDLCKDEPFMTRAYVGLAIHDDEDTLALFRIKPSMHNLMIKAPLCIEFPFSEIGTKFISIEDLKHDSLDIFCKTLFTQILLEVSKGNSLEFLGKELVKAHTEDIAIVQCDMAFE